MRTSEVRPVSAEEAAICAHEERLFQATFEAISSALAAPRRGRRGAGLASLRDDYAEAGEEDRPALLGQFAEEAAREEARALHGATSLPDARAPYFGHMRVVSGGRRRDILLGEDAFVDADRGVAIVDWRKAPIAEVFFTSDPGDEYEIEAGGRFLEGTLERRHLIAFEGGELSAITVDGGTLRRSAGAWSFDPSGLVPSIEGAPKANEDQSPGALRGGGPKMVMAGLLDAHQAALLDRDPAEPLLVLGSAGCGKTTVALHRAAALCKKYPERFAEEGTLVVVPEPGLRRFAERLLADLGIERAAVRTFDDWIRAEARRVFPWLPARESPDPPFAVSRLKRHPAMLEAIERLLEDSIADIANRLDRKLAGRGAVADAIAKERHPILAERLRAAERSLARAAKPDKKRAIEEDFRAERAGLAKVRADLARLVGDRSLLELAVTASGGELPLPLIEQVAAHTNQQLEDPAEVRFAHIDAERLATLDGRSLDDGTPEATAGTVDVEDYALLFELLYRKTGKTGTRSGKLATYASLVLDEAQELSPIELRALGRAIPREGASITVAGDAAQRIDKTGYFNSWDAAMAALCRGPRTKPAYLETSYRCSRPIIEFAHGVLGPDAPDAAPRAVRDGEPVLFSRLPTDGHAAVAIAHALRDLRGREPHASVAVIASDAKAARALHAVLSRALTARLVEDGDFSFGPGVEVTAVEEVKGLEFDYVIVPDASARVYPDAPEHRRRLHVAATRAAHRLWLVSPGAPSPIIPRGLAV